MQEVTFMSYSTLSLVLTTKLNTFCSSIHAKLLVEVMQEKRKNSNSPQPGRAQPVKKDNE